MRTIAPSPLEETEPAVRPPHQLTQTSAENSEASSLSAHFLLPSLVDSFSTNLLFWPGEIWAGIPSTDGTFKSLQLHQFESGFRTETF